MIDAQHDERTLTRRQMLAGLAAAALGASLAPGLAGCSDRGDSGGGAAESSFWQVIADEAQATDPSLNADSALSELDLDLPAPRTAEFDDPSEALLAELAHRISDDFGADRTLTVTGWLLARTEVLLAVVASEAQA